MVLPAILAIQWWDQWYLGNSDWHPPLSRFRPCSLFKSDRQSGLILHQVELLQTQIMVSRSRTTEVSPPQFGLPHVTTEPSSRIAAKAWCVAWTCRTFLSCSRTSRSPPWRGSPQATSCHLEGLHGIIQPQWQAMRSTQRTSGRLQVPYFGGLWDGKALTATTRTTVTSSIVRSKSQANAYHA